MKGGFLVSLVDLVGVGRGVVVGVNFGFLDDIPSSETSYSEGCIVAFVYSPFCLHAIAFSFLKFALIGRWIDR